jgi:hypothetical protein
MYKKDPSNPLKTVIISSLALMLITPIAFAETDKEIQEKALIARELQKRGNMDHSMHMLPESTSKYRGVFYGYLPCREKDCNGIKMTMSLNANDRYLLVIQPAKAQNRESFEKGTYDWNEKEGTLILTPNKEAPQRRFTIQENGLLYISSDGGHLTGEKSRYLFQKMEQAGGREVHIH